MSEPPDDVVEGLYAGDPKAFVATRDAAVKELRAGGKREEAAAVKALARPTVAAAGVNHAVRAGALEELWAAGDALAAAQTALLAGDADAAALREAKATHEEALGAAVEVAGEGARETLRAASVDAAVREAVAGGRLVRELEPGSGAGGFGGFTGFEAAPGGPKRPAKAKGAATPGATPAKRAGTAKARAGDKGRDAEKERKAAAERAAQAAEEAAARAKERAKQRKALKKKLEPARARAARSASATEAAREALDRAAAASIADAERLAALEAELEAHVD